VVAVVRVLAYRVLRIAYCVLRIAYRVSRIAYRKLLGARFAACERGSVAVQALLLLPVMVLVVFGAYAIFGAMEAKQALHHGTYQAVRYLSLNPPANQQGWYDVAEELIRAELVAQVGEERARQLRLRVDPPRILPPELCDPSLTTADRHFTLEAELWWSFDVPFAHFPTIRLRERYRGQVQC